MAGSEEPIRRAEAADAGVVGPLLHDFNREFDEPTSGPALLAVGRATSSTALTRSCFSSGPVPTVWRSCGSDYRSGARAWNVTSRSYTWRGSGGARASAGRWRAMLPFNGEDFAMFLNHIPGAMFGLGVTNTAAGFNGHIHAPTFTADEHAISLATQATAGWLSTRLDALAQA